jgi:hypothetical protein
MEARIAVIPANAGIHGLFVVRPQRSKMVPAFAGTTVL